MKAVACFTVLVIVGLTYISAIHGAPTNKQNEELTTLRTQAPKNDAVVSQLVGLKTTLGDTKTGSANGNHGNQETMDPLAAQKHPPKSMQLKAQATKKSQVVLEEEAPMMSIKEEIERRLAYNKQMDILSHYSPLDLALYIIRTGDDQGVSQVIKQLLAEGLITTEEALEYLQKIREILQYYSEKSVDQDVIAPYDKKLNSHLSSESMVSSSDSDYENIMEKLSERSQTTEQGLQQVVYEMAKLIFYHATERDGEIGSEAALREISLILAKQVERGAISVELEKRILELVIGSLVDSFNEDQMTPESRLAGKAKYSRLSPSTSFRKDEQNMHSLLPFTKLSVKREAKLTKF